MRLQYKISIVIICFAVFYIGIISIVYACIDPANNCIFLAELMTSTRLVITDSVMIEYVGTLQIEEPTIENFISQNVSFLVTMIVIPTCIVGGIILSKRR